MATGFKSWDTSAANNATADSSINWQEGQLPPTVNNSARAMMAVLAAWRDNIGFGTITSGTVGGTANAITLTVSPTVEARTAGRRYLFKYTAAGNSGAVTLAVDALSAAAIQFFGAALVSGDIATNDWVHVVDDGTNFQLLSKPRLSDFGINGLTADGTGAVGDFLLTYDISASLPKKLLFSTLQTLFATDQATQETGTSNTKNVTTGTQVFHDSALKAWMSWDGTGTPTAVDVFNFATGSSGITDNGAGDYTLTFTTAFSATANYAMAGMCNQATLDNMSSQYMQLRGTSAAGAATTTVRLNTGNTGTGVPGDENYNGVLMAGDR